MSKKAVTAAILVLGLTLLATWFLAGREADRQEISTRRAQISEISAIQANLQNNLEMQTALIHILRAIVAITPNLDQQQFENIINALEPRPEGVLVLAKGGIISSVYPNDLEENFIGLNLLEMPRLADAARQVMDTHFPVLTGPFIFKSGKRSLIYLSELSTRDGDKSRPWGVGLLLIDLDRLLASISFDNWARGSIAIRLHQASGVPNETLYGNGKLFVQPTAVVNELENPGNDWDVAVMPFPPPGGETMILMIWSVGIPVSIVFSILIYRILVELVERRKTQAALQQSEDRLEDVLQATSDWMWETDENFRFTNISGRMRAVTGLKAADVLGKTRLELADTSEDRELLVEHEEIMRARQPFRDFRYSLNTPAHGTTYLRTSGTPVYDHEERFVGYWGTTTDITAEIEAQNRATQAERLLHDAAESMVEGLALFDAGGNLQVFNARFSTLLKENGIGEDVSLYTLLMEIIDRNFTKGEEAFKEVSSPEHIPPRLEFPIRSGHWIHLSSQKTHDGGLVSIWTDISERKKHEEERSILEDELRQAQKLEAIGTLAGGIAHEINTPTQYIGDNLQFINDSFVDVFDVIDKARALIRENEESESVHAALLPLEESLKKADVDYLMEEIPTALKQSLEGISQVGRIVKAMKEFSHPVNAEHGPADLNRAIENTVAVCRNEWKHVAELTLDLDPALPLVNCHLGEINQVFLNLIVNAAHAVESAQRGIGQIHVESRQDGEWVDVRISDTGIGIPENIIYKIFDLFFTTKKVGKGSGQGLPIARDIVRRRHGGNILVESTAGVGTTFTVRLPIAGKAKETESDEMEPENMQSGETENSPTYRILFVDDEGNVLNALRRMLRGKLPGCDLLFVDNGLEALEILTEKPIDVIVSDMRMPGMDGATLLARVRQIDPKVVRIVLSGFASEESILRAVGPAHQYLAKPCSSDALCDVIERALSLRRFVDEPELLSLVGGIETLPSPPGIYSDLMAALEDPNGSSRHIAEIISRDIAMVAETLKLTSSHYFALPNGVVSVEQAVRILGIPTIRTLVLSVGVFREFRGTEDLRWLIERITQRALLLADQTRVLAEAAKLDKSAVEQSFCAGMLAEIGILIMIDRWSDRYLDVLKCVKNGGISLEDAEEQEFGVSHARLGGYLMGLWGVNDPVVEAICYQNTPSRSSTRALTPLTMLHVAHYLNTDGVLLADVRSPYVLDERYLEESGALRLMPLWQRTLSSMTDTEREEQQG